ncbi:hypothetical protein MNBD_CHLOROFLEXI01-3130 [hydrothermal vent metagenome]|uniref:Uncharacterized protein n=1 Tax=hydrothermal vent metagenome TaxID=652676 RepID=A0A3B0VJD5_9ZZZZ
MSTITIEMTPQEFQRIIAATVENAIDRKFDEWLDGLEDDGELRPEIGEQLLRLRRERQEGKRGTPLAVVAEELGLDISSGS